MKRIAWAFGPLLVLALLVSTAFCQNVDRVMGHRGIPTLGSVTEMTPTQVTVTDLQGKKKPFPVNMIRSIRYANEPKELQKARESVGRGQFESARADLDQISINGITRKEVLQDIQFYKGFCDGQLALIGGGDKNAAVKSLLSFLGAENKDNYHFYEAVELVGDLAVGLERYKKAGEYYQQLGTAPWPDYKLRATELEARAILADGRSAEAMQKFEEVLASGLETAEARELKNLATCGKAVCISAEGKSEEGIKLIEAIISDNDSQQQPLLFARAYNALGNCYLRAEQPEDALLAFLHVSLLFHQSPDAHAESLYHLSKLWRVVKKPDRGIRAQGMLRTRYSGSRWANKE